MKSLRHATRDRRRPAPALSVLPRRRPHRSVPRCPGVSRLNLFCRRVPALSRRIPPCPGESRHAPRRRRPSVPRTPARCTPNPANPRGIPRDVGSARPLSIRARDPVGVSGPLDSRAGPFRPARPRTMVLCTDRAGAAMIGPCRMPDPSWSCVLRSHTLPVGDDGPAGPRQSARIECPTRGARGCRP